jgi:hypothetical protein
MFISWASILLEGVTMANSLLLSFNLEVVLVIALGLRFLGVKDLAIVRFHEALLLESP